jgi:hypothetical protein
MTARARQFASLRMPPKMKQQIRAMADVERRTLSAMLLILVEEALERRLGAEEAKRPASQAAD